MLFQLVATDKKNVENGVKEIKWRELDADHVMSVEYYTRSLKSTLDT